MGWEEGQDSNVHSPIRDVSGAHHGGNVDHWVPGYTSTVGLRVLTNQVAGEEPTMGTTHKGHASCIKVFLLEYLLHCKLKWAEDTTVRSLAAESHESTLPVQQPTALLPGHPSHPGGPHCLGEKGCCLGQSQWSHDSSLKVRQDSWAMFSVPNPIPCVCDIGPRTSCITCCQGEVAKRDEAATQRP